ncbi:ferritin-like domain-containing protein [Halanaerobaculum tunisiense]
MEDRRLIKILNWFYFLEINQYQLYKKQKEESKDDYIKKVLDKFAKVEKDHVLILEREIRHLGGQSSELGTDLGLLFGATTGSLTSWGGTVNLFSVNLALERRAIKDYRKLIQQTNSQQLKEVLWSNLIEEDLHHSWFAHQRQELRDQKKSQENLTES